ncbi:MAG TPA: nickel-responsive transcriptional regulator NikR, partial [Bacteroidales bacterium]|nr:nickel-responsive transcriptional regulator NikR [Bacteroidales bacterium]
MHTKRFGVSLDEELLKEFDTYISGRYFSNRSQAIGFILQKYLTEEAWQGNQEVAGAIILIYDHHRRELQNKSTNIQHEYHHLVLSVQHVHLDHHKCLETLAVKGRARELTEFSNHLIGIKGI